MREYPFIGENLAGNCYFVYSKGKGVGLDDNTDYGNLNDKMFKDVTKDYLKNTKIRVESPEHSEFVQKLALRVGYKWFRGATCVKHTDSKYLFFYEDMDMTHSESKRYFDIFLHKETNLPYTPAEVSNTDTATPWPKIDDNVVWDSRGTSDGAVKSLYNGFAWVEDNNGELITLEISSLKKPLSVKEDMLEILCAHYENSNSDQELIEKFLEKYNITPKESDNAET